MADERISLNEAARRAGVTPATLKRWAEEKIVPVKRGRWTPAAAAQARVVARMREAGFPLVAFLQLVRVYAQSLRKIADTEVRLFHLYIHEPLIRDGVPELEMATEMRELTEDLRPMATPLFEYMHNRYLRFFI